MSILVGYYMTAGVIMLVGFLALRAQSRGFGFR